MNIEDAKKDLEAKMQKSFIFFARKLGALRTGRVAPALVEGLRAEAYGSMMPLEQLASIAVADARTLTIDVWDKALVSSVSKAISQSPLGLTPNEDGALLRLNVPPLTHERRLDILKLANKEAEESRISIRQLRKEAMTAAKKDQKDTHLSEDDLKRYEKMIQTLTDSYIGKIDHAFKDKEKEIMDEA